MHMGQPALLYLVPCCLGTHALWVGDGVKDLLGWPQSVYDTFDNIPETENTNRRTMALPYEDGINAIHSVSRRWREDDLHLSKQSPNPQV
jgi:hypothetical protein